MSNHKRNWMLVWTAIGALAVTLPVGWQIAKSIVIVSETPVRLDAVEKDLHEVRQDVHAIKMSLGVNSHGTNYAEISH